MRASSRMTSPNRNRVRFVGDRTVVGTLIGYSEDGWPHVVWDGDTWTSVLAPDEVEQE